MVGATDVLRQHFAFRVPDLDRAIATLGARGVNVVLGPLVLERVGLRFCLLRDPNGVLLELVQRLGGAP